MRPFEGRRLWLAGIGGAGMSGYALLAHEWGADVQGWDRTRTPYLEHLPPAIEFEIAPDPPSPPRGWEVYVSSAFADRVTGRSRAELLAELVSRRDAVVVAGAHGKTTTTAMIAYVLRELGEDPAWLVGAEVPQLGGNAGGGEGWLVVEGDESDRTIESLRPKVAVVTNVDLDHHATFASRAEVEDLFARWLAHLPHVVCGEELEPYGGRLAVLGAHNRANAAAALAALELVGVERNAAKQVIARFHGAARRLELRGEAGGIRVVDDYAHNPAKIVAALAAIREGEADRVLVLFQPHLYSRTRHLARELGSALTAADAVAVTEIYAAREEPVSGVSGKLVVDAVAELRPGMPLAWTPNAIDGAHFVAGRSRAGDVVVTLGAGDVDRTVPMLLEELG